MPASDTRLRYIARSYFHQDYDLDASDPAAIVRVFVDEEVPLVVRQLRQEIAALLTTDPSEVELQHLWIDDLRASFEPRKIGLTYREWFVRMLEILDGGAGGTDVSPTPERLPQ